MPLSKVRLPDRHPYEFYLLGACALFAVLDLGGFVPTPASITQQVPTPWLWSTLLLIGAAIALTAILWPRRHPRRDDPSATWTFHLNLLLLEQLGLVMAGVSAGFYAAAMWTNLGAVASFAILMNGGFCVASIAQAFIIQKFIRQIRAALRLAAKIAAEARHRDGGERP